MKRHLEGVQMYLPKDATIEQACAWLEALTGETWILPRLLECHLTPYFWNDYKPGYPAVYGDRREGYQTRMIFQGDRTRLESDGGIALVTMFAAHDGSLIRIEPGWPLALSDLRFKREEIERVAEIINASKQPQAAPEPAPVANAPASEQQTKRRTIWDVATPYIVETMRAGQYANAKQLFNALEAKAGHGSPFDKGIGQNRGSLFVREISATLALKTLQTNFPKLQMQATKN